jgi:hypothetical protein
MNDTPLTDDQVDELLSAEIDGEFDAAARDLGLDPSDARERLALEVPGLAARRSALQGARDVLAELPPVDELVVARLRAKAVRAAVAEQETAHATSARRLRRLAAIGAGLAAAIAVIAGLTLTLQHNHGSSSKSSAALSPEAQRNEPAPKSAASAIPVPKAADFGAVADVSTLVARASAQASDLARLAPANAKRAFSNDSAFSRALPAASPACVPAAAGVSGTPNPILRGVATLSGTPVQVYVFRKGADEVVVVLRADCRLVTAQTRSAPAG